MKNKEIKVLCAQCGAPLVVARREEWKDRVLLELMPCVPCLEKRYQDGRQEVADER